VDQVPNPRMAYIVAKNKERKQRRRAHLLEMLGGKCVRCGTTDGLVFDHIDPSTKAFTIGGNLERPWDVLLAEVRKTQLLCPPCHKIKSAEDRPESPHGTIYRYSDLGCRCDLCRAANAAKSARRRARFKDSGDFSMADVESQPHNPRSEAPVVDTTSNVPGLRILDRNWRCAEGEIDIVAAERQVLVICEVKTRSSTQYGSPLEAITRGKRTRLRRLAVRWLLAHGVLFDEVRIDVFGLVRDESGRYRIEHVRGVG
jgi:putative endonuclease